jgi:hypothetical protein
MTATDLPPVLPVGPMARYLRAPGRWLRAEAEAGRVPSLRSGKVLLFHPPAVEKALAARAAGEEVAHVS